MDRSEQKMRFLYALRSKGVTDARVLALALNGTIKSSIPLTVKDKWGPRWGEATLGAGEPVISIDVITGAIVIDAPAAAR